MNERLNIACRSCRGAWKGSSSRQAFSLVELLVSTAILVLLIGLLTVITNRITAAWVQSAGQAERWQNVRAMADFISNDLRGAMLPVNVADTQSLQFVLNPPGLGAEYRNADALFWQAPVATDDSHGDIAEVGYFVKWFVDSSGRPVARLCRFYADPTDSAHFLIYSRPAIWLDDSLLQAVAPATESQTEIDNFRGLFAENVVGFWVRCFDREHPNAADAALEGFDSREPITLKDGSKQYLPSRVEISIALIDSHAAARMTDGLKSAIQSLVAGSRNAATFLQSADGDSALRPILSGLRTYTTTVYLKNSR